MLKITFVLLVIVGVAQLILTGVLDNKSARGEMRPYSELSTQYLFLLFPKRDCEQLRSAAEKCPDRAVLVAKEEIDSGMIRFSDAQDSQHMINATALEYVPAVNAEILLKNWYRVLPNVSDYSGADWKEVMLTSGTYEIRLALNDASHARKDQFVYFVKNGKVLGAKAKAVIGVFELALLTCLALLAAGVIGYAILIQHRRTSKAEK